MLISQQADDLMGKIRDCEGRSLPTKSYCKTFLETYPSIHVYRKKLEGRKQNDLADDSIAENFSQKISVFLERIWFSILSGQMAESFATLQSFEVQHEEILNGDIKPISDCVNMVSAFFDLLGTFYHLNCNFHKAIRAYKKAIAMDKSNFESPIKLANVYTELGDDNGSAEELYSNLCKSHSGVSLAWCLLHRASVFINRQVYP